MNCTSAQLDRYPAKMVGKLASTLIEKYADNGKYLFDPFCGSGAILSAANRKGIRVCGTDINPYATLLSEVKLGGFSVTKATLLLRKLIESSSKSSNALPAHWPLISYWFTEATLQKLYRLRFWAKKLRLSGSKEGKAVLLAFANSIRRCSRSDQLSPKPFISKEAISSRKGKHFDPFKMVEATFERVCDVFGGDRGGEFEIFTIDVVRDGSRVLEDRQFSHIITSPPYINAQDYFRNFKIELYLLEGLLPATKSSIQSNFVGTESGVLLDGISTECLDEYRSMVSGIDSISKRNSKSAAIIYRYLHDMSKTFDVIKELLSPNGVFVLVCGDNLIAREKVSTWQYLNQLLEKRNFNLIDQFHDAIGRRSLAPTRSGHKGLIKTEVISAFRST